MRKILQIKKTILSALLLGSLSTSAQVPTPQLIHYKFDTPGTSVVNYATTSTLVPSTGTIIGAQTQTGSINCMSALIGTGASSTTDYINTGWNSAYTGPWSISFWTANNPASTTLFYIFGEATSSFRCFTNGVAGTNNWIIRGTGITDILLTGAATVSPNLVTVVYDNVAGLSTSYINGVQTGTVTQTTSMSFGGTGGLKVGAYSANTGLGLNQTMADFRIYSSVLTSTQVAAIYALGTPSALTLATTGATNICSGQSTTLTASGAANYTWSAGSSTNTASNVLSPSTTTAYTITGQTGLCTGSVVANVSVTPIPTVAIAGPTAVCIGTSATLTASGAITYNWSNAATVAANAVSPTITTIYTATGTTNGCSGIATRTLVINSNPTITVNSGAICAGNSFTLTPSGASTYTYSGGSAVVSPTATSAYTVTGTNTVGCNGSAVSNVTVNVAPTISVNSGAICAGNSFTMTPSGASTYTFSGGSAVVSPTATSAYTVTGTNTLGCNGSAVSNVTVNALPTVSAASSNTTFICVGSSATLTASGASSYVWNTTATTAVIAVSPTTTTSYTVTGTGANGCSANAVISQSVNTCTGIDNLSFNISNLSFQVYPNPSTGIFNVQLENATTIEITDVLGRVILTDKVNAGNYQLNLGNNVNGVYFVKATVDGKTKTVKIVKE